MQICVIRQCFYPPGDTLSAFSRMKFTEVAMHHTHIVFIVVAVAAVFVLFAILRGREAAKESPEERERRRKLLEDTRMANTQANNIFNQRRPF
jgi:hypothetical protein